MIRFERKSAAIFQIQYFVNTYIIHFYVQIQWRFLEPVRATIHTICTACENTRDISSHDEGLLHGTYEYSILLFRTYFNMVYLSFRIFDMYSYKYESYKRCKAVLFVILMYAKYTKWTKILVKRPIFALYESDFIWGN